MRTGYGVVPSHKIYNACFIGWDYQISDTYKERWWDDEFSELRELMMGWFYELFEHHTGGHYTKLAKSIEEHGFLNPIIVSYGALLRRQPWQVHPHTLRDHGFVCENNGGSRLRLAHLLKLDIPCIINNAPSVYEELFSVSHVREKFHDKTYSITRSEHEGITTNPQNLSHLGRFGFSENQRAVTASKTEMRRRAFVWLEERGL